MVEEVEEAAHIRSRKPPRSTGSGRVPRIGPRETAHRVSGLLEGNLFYRGSGGAVSCPARGCPGRTLKSLQLRLTTLKGCSVRFALTRPGRGPYPPPYASAGHSRKGRSDPALRDVPALIGPHIWCVRRRDT